MKVALVHDYLTQRGGAERVVLSLTRAFPDAAVFTSLYDPGGTFPEFADVDVRALPINRFAALRRHHRVTLPILAPSFSCSKVTADVVICSSSGWAHGTRVDGRKVVYCHTPARWLYQSDRYLRDQGRIVTAIAQLLRSPLTSWDRRAAQTADFYVANSTAVADRIKSAYGIDAQVVPPPPALSPDGPMRAVAGLEPGFVLCVSRLLAYKNVDAVIRAFVDLPREQLVVAGTGPQERALRAVAGRNVKLVGRVTDDELRWLYANCRGLVAASNEDFGLTPLEAATFGKPTVALRWGGFLDTIEEGQTGMFFDSPTPRAIADGIASLLAANWGRETIVTWADGFSETEFIRRLRTIASTV